MASSPVSAYVNASIERPTMAHSIDRVKTSISPAVKVLRIMCDNMHACMDACIYSLGDDFRMLLLGSFINKCMILKDI